MTSAAQRYPFLCSGFHRLLLACALALSGGAANAQAPGAAVYAQYCASCHEQVEARIPTRAALAAMSPARILRTLDFGLMMSIASPMKRADREAVASFLGTGSKSVVRDPAEVRKYFEEALLNNRPRGATVRESSVVALSETAAVVTGLDTVTGVRDGKTVSQLGDYLKACGVTGAFKSPQELADAARRVDVEFTQLLEVAVLGRIAHDEPIRVRLACLPVGGIAFENDVAAPRPFLEHPRPRADRL